MAKLFMSTFPPESNDKTEDVVCVRGNYVSIDALFELENISRIEAVPVKAGSPAKTKLVLRDGEDVHVVHVAKPLAECSALYDKAHSGTVCSRPNDDPRDILVLKLLLG